MCKNALFPPEIISTNPEGGISGGAVLAVGNWNNSGFEHVDAVLLLCLVNTESQGGVDCFSYSDCFQLFALQSLAHHFHFPGCLMVPRAQVYP